ncbi:MAG: site-specific integrase [Deltaproteobacteria bacterium]|jgi:integrase|nr:site-specific integrase [Deltaproteobacteria bacterium]
MSIHKTKNGLYFVAYREEASRSVKKKYFGRGLDGKKMAKIWEIDYLKNGKKEISKKDIYFYDLARNYLCNKDMSSDTKYNTEKLFNKHIFSKCYWEKIPVNQLTLKDLWDVEKNMIDKKSSLITRNHLKSKCKTVCQWAVDNNIIKINPFIGLKLDRKNENQAPDLITEEELRKIYDASSDHVKWVIKVMVNTGVRAGKSELFAIKMADVDYEKKGIWITRTKTKSKRTLLPVKEKFLEEIHNLYKKDKNRVYLIEYNDSQVKKIQTAWNSTLDRAGITRRIRLYDLRHFYASALLQSGIDLKVVSELMGHSTPKTTLATYYHLANAQVKEALQNADILEL